jgi:pimeloyl-ACP methyl ester carboxylesterase
MEGQIRYVQGISWPQLDALAEGHRQLPGPVLLIWGEEDPFFPIEDARAMIPQFKNCRGLVPISGAKLLPHEERPEAVARHVLEFFDAR